MALYCSEQEKILAFCPTIWTFTHTQPSRIRTQRLMLATSGRQECEILSVYLLLRTSWLSTVCIYCLCHRGTITEIDTWINKWKNEYTGGGKQHQITIIKETAPGGRKCLLARITNKELMARMFLNPVSQWNESRQPNWETGEEMNRNVIQRGNLNSITWMGRRPSSFVIRESHITTTRGHRQAPSPAETESPWGPEVARLGATGTLMTAWWQRLTYRAFLLSDEDEQRPQESHCQEHIWELVLQCS